ncbi:probable glutathione S-transferase isoform X1 [Arachis stenosperma]|uniref:probable glutathione S-transferase isoform X1 n=1 Tax=Arachis stenosperma TaxID=217475 RepID=UPI0025ABADC4|nr:probable glutathione S-transferase isoform X1 [Arachis stenosperma]
MEDLKLHGFWYSPFTMRVVWTLKLKGLSYENIEEDRFNKSPQLLEYNPVHKKTPVLVHGGKPICESMLILEYIEELWPQNPLVPLDPYQRSQARFWVTYSDQLFPAVVQLILVDIADDEEKKKAIEKVQKLLKDVEDQCLLLVDEKLFFGGDTINMVDIAFGSMIKFLVAMEDLNELKVLEAEKFPRLHSWFNNFKNAPIIKENFSDREKMCANLKYIRKTIRELESSA